MNSKAGQITSPFLIDTIPIWLFHSTSMTDNYPCVGKPPKSPYLWPTNRLTDQPTAEEFNYSRNRARQHQCPTNNLLEVWQNSAIFGGRPIGAAIEVLLTKVVNQQLSVSPIVVFFVAARHAAVSVITQSNGAESIILSVGSAETIIQRWE